jgi:hypothetical protein
MSGPAFLAEIGFLAQEIPLYRRLSAEDHIGIGAHMNPRWDGESRSSPWREVSDDLGHLAPVPRHRRHRGRWLSAKTGWLLLTGAVFGGAVAGIITWWYAPLDALIGRSLPALAVTGGVFLAVRLAVTYAVRVHYISAVTTIYSVTQSFTPKGAYWQLAQGTVLPGGQLSTNLSVGPTYIDQSFHGATLPASCQALGNGPISSVLACLVRLGYHSFTTYQPGYRFWPFQFIETGVFLALAAILVGVTFLVVRRRDA